MRNILYIISCDLTRYGYRSKRGFLKALLIPGFNYMVTFRLMQRYKKTFLIGSLLKFLLKLQSFLFGFQIELYTSIGRGFYIGHHGSIVINGDSKIGINCNIAHGVTIGKENRGDRKGAPTIGDEVWIGTNAIIVGRITIGNNVLIAPGAFVNYNVPSNSIVVGNPCRIIYNEFATQNYINNKTQILTT